MTVDSIDVFLLVVSGGNLAMAFIELATGEWRRGAVSLAVACCTIIAALA